MPQKIVPFLWFDKTAEQAVAFYQSVFDQLKITDRMKTGSHTMSFTIELSGQEFIIFNAPGPQFQFSPAMSMFVRCDSQEEIDYYWQKLSTGGKILQCGWLTDQFGLSWQIVPNVLGKLLSSPDRAKSQAAMNAMLKMTKLVIKDLQDAYDRG
ncbi:MAG: VOC family protein [Alphaproteobacteria bacterium]|nr:VOC family protein [Alphaproteobacteria bacterium]